MKPEEYWVVRNGRNVLNPPHISIRCEHPNFHTACSHLFVSGTELVPPEELTGWIQLRTVNDAEEAARRGCNNPFVVS